MAWQWTPHRVDPLKPALTRAFLVELRVIEPLTFSMPRTDIGSGAIR